MNNLLAFLRSREPHSSLFPHTLQIWLLALNLLLFMGITQLLIVIAFFFNISPSTYTVVLAIVLTMVMTDIIARGEGCTVRQRVLFPFGLFVVLAGSMFAAKMFYDMSWDGLWYHQTAVYQMAHGWNPVYDSMHGFVDHLRDWVRHYAKGPWYLSLAFLQLTGDIEMAKVGPWISLVATFLAVWALFQQLGLTRLQSILLAILIAGNPVVIFELPSYLVDGMMISFLVCFVAGFIMWTKTASRVSVLVMVISVILCVNAKQTGMVYLCFAFAAAGIYLLLHFKERLVAFISIQAAGVFLAVALFGFNPYITNTIYRGHPFYPMLGTTAYPSLEQQGQDPIEQWETPHNMMGTSRFTRLSYALFGRPSAAPYYPSQNAEYMYPFHIGWGDFAVYYFHDVRISGFGPMFSGIFLLSLILLCWVLILQKEMRFTLLLMPAVIIASLLISQHTWWARYGPQLWWIPIIIIAAAFLMQRRMAVRRSAWLLLILLYINTVPLAAVHFSWEYNATKTTREQLRFLKDKQDIQIDFQYFGEPFAERLKAAGIRFKAVPKLTCPKPMELMSVSPGYPCAVRACYAE